LSFLLQFGPKASDLPADVPAMADLVTTARDRAFVSMLDITQHTGRVMFTTPDVPGERLKALRVAFDATMADTAFVAEMTRLRFDRARSGGAVRQAAMGGVMQERDTVGPQWKALLNLD